MTAETPEGGASGRFERMGRRMDQRLSGAVPRLEDEVRKMISYLDDQVVPILRKNSSIGLRAAAEQLRALAERLERVQERDVDRNRTYGRADEQADDLFHEGGVRNRQAASPNAHVEEPGAKDFDDGGDESGEPRR